MASAISVIFNKCRNRSGFTLVELMIVMVIIGILATIAVPMFIGQRTRAMQKEALTNLEALRLLQEQYYAEKGEYAASLGTCAKDNTDNVDTIRTSADGLPAFKPGLGADLYFSYCIQQNKAINSLGALVDETPCFVARAFGNSGNQIAGQEFRVDCNNVKTY
jgi:prepilin-type N-terminal cleavage/methylation domain-containing protein